MPLYEYVCKDCQAQFEELMSASDTTCPPCPKCASYQTCKLMSACRSRVSGNGKTGATASVSSGGGCTGCAGGHCATCH